MKSASQKIEYRDLTWIQAAQLGVELLKGEHCPEGDDPSGLLNDSTVRVVFGIVLWVLANQHVTEKQSIALQNIQHTWDAECQNRMDADGWDWTDIEF